MNLILVVLVSAFLVFIFSLLFKKLFILFLVIAIPSSILLEILITKDVSAFYYRYYYHWLFLLPLLLVLPLGFIKEGVKGSKLVIAVLLVWGVLVVWFPLKMVINNIRYLNTDSTWFDRFAKEYAFGQVGIDDYINWQFPKTKEIIKWCNNQRNMVDLYSIDPNLVIFDNEKLLRAFFVKCNYRNFELYESNNLKEQFRDIVKRYPGVYYVSLEKCQPGVLNSFSDEIYSDQYELNQKLICSSKEIMPYLYILPN